jgi:hypothetical protein
MIRKHTRRAAKAAFAISLGVAIIVGGASAATTGSSRSTATPIIVGTKNFGEAFVLGELYKQALEAKGFDVAYKENIGSTELIQKALTSGKITLYPRVRGDRLHRHLQEEGVPGVRPGDVRHGQEAVREEGLHGPAHDALPGRRRCRRAPYHRDEVRPEVGRRPEEGPGPDARGVPRVPHPRDRARRHEGSATASPT